MTIIGHKGHGAVAINVTLVCERGDSPDTEVGIEPFAAGVRCQWLYVPTLSSLQDTLTVRGWSRCILRCQLSRSWGWSVVILYGCEEKIKGTGVKKDPNLKRGLLISLHRCCLSCWVSPASAVSCPRQPACLLIKYLSSCWGQCWVGGLLPCFCICVFLHKCQACQELMLARSSAATINTRGSWLAHPTLKQTTSTTQSNDLLICQIIHLKQNGVVKHWCCNLLLRFKVSNQEKFAYHSELQCQNLLESHKAFKWMPGMDYHVVLPIGV